MHAVSIGFLGGVTTSESDSTIDGTNNAYLGSSTTIESPGTNIHVHVTHVGEADSTASGGAGGALGAAVLSANGTDSPTLNAYVDTGAVIGNGNGTPGSLTVIATATEGTNVNANAGTGGIVSFGGISATSTLQPSVNAYLVGNETVVLVHDLTVQAILNHAEGHTRATAYGGGIAQIGSANATANTNPTVTAFIGTGSVVQAGGNVTIDAQNLSHQTGTPLTDNFNADSSDVNQSTGTIQFGSHGLTTGDAVLYVSNGNLLPGMRQGCGAPLGGCIYTAVVVDANHIQFGDTFTTAPVDASGIPGFCGTSHLDSCPGVDANRDVIRFASPHNFVTGDPVILSGSGAIGASTGVTLYVRVLDPYTVALYTTHAAAVDAGVAFAASAVSGGAIGAGNSFSSGEQLTYVTAPGLTFNKSTASTSIPTTTPPRDSSCLRHRARPGVCQRQRADALRQLVLLRARPVHRPEGHLPDHRAGRRRPDRRRHLLRHRRQPVRHPARRDPATTPSRTPTAAAAGSHRDPRPQPDPPHRTLGPHSNPDTRVSRRSTRRRSSASPTATPTSSIPPRREARSSSIPPAVGAPSASPARRTTTVSAARP